MHGFGRSPVTYATRRRIKSITVDVDPFDVEESAPQSPTIPVCRKAGSQNKEEDHREDAKFTKSGKTLLPDLLRVSALNPSPISLPHLTVLVKPKKKAVLGTDDDVTVHDRGRGGKRTTGFEIP